MIQDPSRDPSSPSPDTPSSEAVDRVAILDCGGQYTKVIDRKVRELGVCSEIFPLTVDPAELEGFAGIILSGGPSSVWGENPPDAHPGLWELPVPMLGICYGMQLLNARFGGVVSGGQAPEYGVTRLSIEPGCPLFAGLEGEQKVLMSHGDAVEKVAPEFRVVGESDDAVGAIAWEARGLYGVQFHPEVDLTEHGRAMLGNFLTRVCGLSGNYRLPDRVETALEKIRAQVGEHPVLVLVSGGVDSAVSAVLLLRALGPERVHAIHVDHGLMRKGESDHIVEVLRGLGLTHLTRVDAAEDFFGAVVEIDGRPVGPLTELVDPEEKRQLIGEVFLRVLRRVAGDLDLDLDDTYWAQGTLRPDLIESGNPMVSGFAQKIKTHHNDIELVRRARERGMVVETNWDWHKDEVRQVARLLGIPEEIAGRQPFPGPGLAVRLIADEGTERVPEEDRRAVAEAVRAWSPAYDGTIVPVRTVGVQGDQRSYRFLALVAGPAGASPEGANPSRRLAAADWPGLVGLGNRLANRFDQVNRTAYVLNADRIPDDLEHHPLHVTAASVALLQELDALVTRHLDLPSIGQTFAVLLPVGRGGKPSVAIRTIVTDDFMTGRPAEPGKEIPAGVLEALVADLDESLGDAIDLILFDVTSKPPATVEWQ